MVLLPSLLAGLMLGGSVDDGGWRCFLEKSLRMGWGGVDVAKFKHTGEIHSWVATKPCIPIRSDIFLQWVGLV